MELLVLVEDYPNLQGGVNLYFAHARNMSYKQAGLEVRVLNFSAQENYVIDGIEVNTLESYLSNKREGELLILHAPNVRHHYKFLKKYGDKFRYFIFFFHGHEVLRCSKVYPKAYPYSNEGFFLTKMIKDIYDLIKLKIWRNAFEKFSYKSEFVFVSNWMYNEFLRWVKINPKHIENKRHIIYNCIGKEFESAMYDRNANKEYDFVSIRSGLDGSKYCVDVINQLAMNNQGAKFCLYGKGNYFKYNKKAENLDVKYEFLNHDQMIDALNAAKCALMPTRTDAQGVMACEMATFGIPLITSDISVCKEVFAEFENVEYISNSKFDINIMKVYKDVCLKTHGKRNEKYFEKNTTDKEIALFKKLLNQ